jgi:hypothetical protein
MDIADGEYPGFVFVFLFRWLIYHQERSGEDGADASRYKRPVCYPANTSSRELLILLRCRNGTLSNDFTSKANRGK